MKSKKIIAVLISAAMLCSSLPAYAAIDNMSTQTSEYVSSQSVSSDEGTKANQNDESSSQAETEASSEASGNEAINNENNSQTEDNNNILQQNVADSQDDPTEQSVYDLCNGDIDVYYAKGVYHTTQNNEEHTDTQSPVISSNGETSNQVYLHDFAPDIINIVPSVIISDLNIVSDSVALEIDGTVNLDVENDCSVKTTNGACAAINVDGNAKLTISGSGSLYVSSYGNGAAIGSPGGYGLNFRCGNIEITGDVKVTAENIGNGAAIGGGYAKGANDRQYGSDVFHITIGGNADVTATSNGRSAAIGGGGAKSDTSTGTGGYCSSVIIKDDAMVKATANYKGSAAIGSGPNDGAQNPKSSAGGVGTISILDSATVYAFGGYTAIGASADYDAPPGVYLGYDNEAGNLCIENTASLEAYSMTDVPINSECESVKFVKKGAQNNNIIVGDFADNSALKSQVVLQVVDTDSKQYTKNVNMPTGTKSFAFSTPSAENYAILSAEAAPDLSNGYTVDQAIQNIDNHNFLFTSHQLEDGKSFSDYSVSAKLTEASVNMDLSNGSITISKIDDVIYLEQNGQIQMTIPNKENIVISQSGGQTENTITVEGNVDAAQPIILENLNISCEQPIVVENGADVNFIFHNNNSLTATNCQQSTDYPAIEVPGGATVTLSGDGSLEATADGYAAAIGTKGYYRDGKSHDDGDKSSGTVQIDGSLNVKAHSAYGAGIGGGAISGSSCEQHAFDNGTVIIKGNAVVEALGSTEGSYSAGIGGGGCYTSTCAAVGGDGGDVQILDNAHVAAGCNGTLGAGIGGGGGCGKTADGFGGDGESFKADGNAVVVAVGSKYSPGIGGGSAQQKSCCGTHPGNSGSCSVLGNSNVTAQGGERAENFGTGGHTGGWNNHKASYTDPVVDPTATFNY